MTLDDLRLALCRMTVDEQPSEELPLLAALALVAGIDSPSLRECAGCSAGDVREARDLFMAAMSELGVEWPDDLHARGELGRFWAREMLAGTLTPYEASRLIWWRLEDGTPETAHLLPFVGLASEWEDYPPGRPDYEREMLEEARRLAARLDP